MVRLISGTIRFRPDFKNCYPVHRYKEHYVDNAVGLDGQLWCAWQPEVPGVHTFSPVLNPDYVYAGNLRSLSMSPITAVAGVVHVEIR